MLSDRPYFVPRKCVCPKKRLHNRGDYVIIPHKGMNSVHEVGVTKDFGEFGKCDQPELLILVLVPIISPRHASVRTSAATTAMQTNPAVFAAAI